MQARWTRILACAVFLVTLSCVTVNVYFPSAEVEAAADRIVEDVYSAGDSTPGPSSWLAPVIDLFTTPAAYAAEIDIDVSTPAIRGLLAQIEERHTKLVPYYDSGAIGINAKGYLEIRDAGGLDLRQKADLNKLLKAENDDRAALYKEIVKANDLDAASVADVERIFAEKWRQKARPGWQIQADNGAWSKKK